MKKRIAILFMSMIFMVSFVSCSLGKGKKEMGRYLEEEYDMPEGANWPLAMTVLNDKSVAMLVNTNDGKVKYYISKDGGKKWSEKEIMFPSEENKELSINTASISKEGSIFIQYSFYEMQVEEKLQSEDVSTTEDTEADREQSYLDYINNLKYSVIDFEGNKVDLDLKSITDGQANDDNQYMGGLGEGKFTANGDLLLSNNYEEVLQLDAKTGSIKNKFSSDSGYINEFTSIGDSLIIISDQSIKEYDLEKGNEKGNLAALEKYLGINDEKGNADYYNTKLFAGTDNKTLYLYNSKGLYKYGMGSDKVEEIIEGSLCSLGDETMNIGAIAEKDDNKFIAYYSCYEDANKPTMLINYYYSADTPKVPENELKLYSLYDNYDIKQNIVLYQKQHPDVHVVLQVGMSGEDAVTEADALRTLNTKVMSGDGPDILLLQDMEVDTYKEKGLLADMSDALKSYTDKNNLFTNIVDAYSKDGKVYAMPMRFKVPTIVGEKGTVSNITDLQSFTELIQKLSLENKGKILEVMTPAQYATLLYNTNGAAWFNDDGTINTDSLSVFFEEAKKQYDLIKASYPQEDYNSYINDIKDYQDKINNSEDGSALDYNINEMYLDGYIDAISLLTNNPTRLVVGNLCGMDTISEIYSVNKKKEIEYVPLQGQVANVFVPQDVIGISSKSKNKELANDFIKYLFSTEVLSRNTYSGFPVNKEAFDKMCVYAYADQEGYKEGDSIGGMGIGLEDGTSLEVETYWPDKETFSNLKTTIEGLKNPVQVNKTVLNEIVNGFESFVNGEKSSAEAIQTILDNVNIYLSE